MNKPLGKDSASAHVRGYCRICNRHFFYAREIDVSHRQVRQHHVGVCQKGRHSCARIKDNTRA